MRKTSSGNFLVYIVVMVCIMIAVIGGIVWYLISFFSNSLYREFESANQQYVDEIMTRHENDMQIIDDITTQMSLKTDITRFFLTASPEKTFELKKTLESYMVVSNFFDLILYYYQKDEYLYSYSTSVNIDFLIQSGCILQETPADAFYNILSETKHKTDILVEQEIRGRWMPANLNGDKKAALYIQAIPPNLDEKMIYVVGESYYDGLLKDDERESFLYYAGEVIAYRGKKGLEKSSLQALMRGEESELLMDKEGCFQKEIALDGNEYLMSTSVGHSGIRYVTLQHMDTFHAKVWTEQLKILFVAIMISFLLFFVIGFYSSRMMRRLKSINSVFQNQRPYDLRSIEEGIKALNTSKKRADDENLEFQKRNFFRTLLRGYPDSNEELVRSARKYGLTLDEKKYVVILIHSNTVEEEQYIHIIFHNVLKCNESVSGCDLRLLDKKRSLFMVFGNKQEDISVAIEQLHERIANKFGKCQLSVSDFYEDFSNASKAYLEAELAMDFRSIHSSGIVHLHDVIEREQMELNFESHYRRLRMAMKCQDLEGAKLVVRDICEMVRVNNISVYKLRLLYDDIIKEIERNCSDSTSRSPNRFLNFYDMSQSISIDAFYDLLLDAVNKGISFGDKETLKESKMVRDAILYMNHNYCNSGLTMSSLAEHLQISGTTLSLEFQRELGIKPSEFLSNLRMEKAKELLRDTDLRIKDICIAVGYDDDYSFSRVFKKYTGMTASQYREEQESMMTSERDRGYQ